MVRRALKELPIGFKEFHNRLIIVPIDAGLATMAILSGIMSFAGASLQSQLFNDAFPETAAALFNVFYIIAGFSVLGGIGWAYRNLETFGWILIITNLMVRAFVLWSYGGLNPFTFAAILQSVVFGGACLIKIYHLIKKKTVILIKLPETGEHHVPGS